MITSDISKKDVLDIIKIRSLVKPYFFLYVGARLDIMPSYTGYEQFLKPFL